MNIFQKQMIFTGLVFFLIFSLAPAESRADKSNLKTRKPSASTVTSQKVEQALTIIRNGTSHKAVSIALKKLNLNEREQKLLAAKGKQQPYAGIINRLAAVEQKKTKSKLKKKALPKIQRIKQTQTQKQQQQLRRINQQATAKITTLKSRTIKSSTRLMPRQTVMHSGTLPENTGPMARITGVSPQPSVPGARVTIRGENFGTTTRRVYLVLDGNSFECAVQRWRSTSIEVTIPESISSVVGESEKNGTIYIALPRYSHAIRVVPEPSTLIPSISGLSGRNITPGQVLVIEGNQFLTEHRGSVTFRFNGRDIGGRITEWENTYIVVSMPDDIGGLPETAGTLKVQNHAGKNITRSITFKPTIVTAAWERYHTTSATWFVGSKKMFEDNRINLLNGWTVKEYWIEVDVDAWGGG